MKEALEELITHLIESIQKKFDEGTIEVVDLDIIAKLPELVKVVQELN